MGRKKPKKGSASSVNDASADPPTEQQQEQRPTRKRGRPRKIVIEEKDVPEGSLEDVDVPETPKKPRAGTEEQQQPQQQKGVESSSSAAPDVKKEEGEEKPQEGKPRSRGRRKGRPHKST